MALAITVRAEVIYLLDTNIISELRRPRPRAGLVAWLSGEQDTARATIIESWIDAVAALYNVLPMHGGAFRCWVRLMHGKPADLIADAMIAATAVVKT